LWHKDKTLAAHSNGMRFTAFDADDAVLATQVYFSIGGGFILREGKAQGESCEASSLFVFERDELLKIGTTEGCDLGDCAGEREGLAYGAEIRAHVARIWSVMQECVKRGW